MSEQPHDAPKRGGLPMPFGDDNGQGTKKLNELFQEEKKTDVTLTRISETVINQQAEA
jgi:hypothetical protein